MKKIIKEFLFWVLMYIWVIFIFVWPIFLLMLWFDYFHDFQVQMLDTRELSFPRMLVYIWSVIVTIAFISVQFWDELKKLFN